MSVSLTKRYEAYLVRVIKVKLPIHGVKGWVILPEDTKVVVDVKTHLAYYKIYDIQLQRGDYQVVT